MRLKETIWLFIHHHRRNRVVARLARLCKNLHRASEHPGYDVKRNGESSVLSRVVESAAPVLFDVGANIGDWTAMARGHYPDAQLHSFELNPVTAKQLAGRFGGQPGIAVHAFGLAAAAGDVSFFAYEGEASVLSGLRAPLHSHVPHRVERARVRTGDDVCRELKLECVDFLKVDAEGADFEVLMGFSELLNSPGGVQAIQFEHEGGRYLRDFYDLLIPKGYVIGKLYANYVDFRAHDAESEHFLGPNYVALPTARPELIRRLQSGWTA